MQLMTPPTVFAFPPELQAPGTSAAPFEPVLDVTRLPAGSMMRVTRGDLDVLLAHGEAGIVATEDRCPHMSAPLSLGRLEGCIVHCPLHRGAFDLRDGEVEIFPTTGGLTAEGEYRPTWSPQGSAPKAPLAPGDPKAQARAATRVRRLRFLPLRLRGTTLEMAWPR
jgi:nitrite reductase/ring-hydroxylating ferredoxin subunit